VRKIENLNIGHVKHGWKVSFKIKISEVTTDINLETDFPHRHNFYMVCLVIKGSGTHIIDFEEIEIIPNRLFFLKPEQVHFWEIEPNSRLAVIQFSAEFLTSLFSFEIIPALTTTSTTYFDITDEKTASLFEMFRKMEEESNSNERFSEKIIQAEIFILLTEIERLMKCMDYPVPKNNKTDLLNSFKKLLNDKYKEITSISGYARLLNITPNYLNILVKETTGKTAIALMHERVLLEAKRLLIQRNWDITQIAYNLGFKDASYFARFFRKETGQSPSAFRSGIYKIYRHRDK
jgi:AraC-like DNA-binding protein